MRRMFIVVFFTVLSLTSAAFADIKTVCGYVRVQKQCEKPTTCANHFWLNTEKGTVTVVLETWLPSSQHRLLEAESNQRVCVTGVPTLNGRGISAEMVTW
jgi:hypothetical protein